MTNARTPIPTVASWVLTTIVIMMLLLTGVTNQVTSAISYADVRHLLLVLSPGIALTA